MVGDTPDRSTTGAALLIALAALAGAAGVALAAVAAHRVQSPALAVASTMLILHAIATIAVVAAGVVLRARWWLAVAGALLAGAVAFAGSIAATTLAGLSVAGPLAPVGGSLMIVGWAVLAVLSTRLGLAGR